MLLRPWKWALPVFHILLCSCIIVESFQKDGSADNHGGHVAIEIQDSGVTRHHKEKRGGHVSVEIEDSGSTRHHKVGMASSTSIMGSGSSSQMLRREVTPEANLREEHDHLEQHANFALVEENHTAAVSCLWSQWSGWDPPTCSRTCGTGERKKTRWKIRSASGGGRPCDDPHLSQITVACNTFSCPIDCEWMGWAAWTPCTASCGGGKSERIRDKSHTQEHGGTACSGPRQQTRDCSTHACPIDCEVNEWTEWGNCTEECGGGERNRKKSILVPAQHGGAECPAIEENGTCNEDVCPIKAGTRRFSEISTVAAVLLIVATIRMTPSSEV